MAVSLRSIPGFGDVLGAVADSFSVSDPFPSYHISLTVELIYDVPIKAIKNFTKMNEYEYIKEGGLNDYVHMRRKQISQPFTFEIERYVTCAFSDPLATGTELVMPVILWLDKWNKGGGGWNDSESAKMFVFTGCEVVGRSYSEFNAERSGLAVETIKIAYNNMYAISNYAALLGIGQEVDADE